MRRKGTWPLVLMWAAAVLLTTDPVQAYDQTTLVDRGVLTGTVTLVGQVPKPKGYNLVTLPDPVYCGRISNGKGWRLLQPFNVGPDGGFRDVVVLIEGISSGKAFDFEPPRIEAIDCTFKPFITVVRDEHDVTVVNMDPAMHDIQAYETSHLGPRVLFNVPLPISPKYPREAGLSVHVKTHYEGQPMRQAVKMTKGRRIFLMQCGFHVFMESWGIAVDNPYYAMSGKEGQFTIPDIPPGTHQVTVWHPVAGTKEFTVTIEPKGTTTLDVDYEAPTGRLYANEYLDDPRFGIGIMGATKIEPTQELQTY